eukprot:TRINITY_DN3726_c0_g1_i1.p2 TRINITY_DN3726_c0_g1~~TRINITY_DN3726_c0_g1_i1.p2  ORF type:complete len:185 (-),score=21.97 TRINITY_DN3726_c0_g1_i1:24-578(-)
MKCRSTFVIITKKHKINLIIVLYCIQRYEMLIGIPPFYHSNQYVMFQLILEAGLQFPKSIEITKECQHFISMVFYFFNFKQQNKLNCFFLQSYQQKNPNDRLGKDGFDEIQGHPWFANVQWERFQKKEVKPEFLPNFGGTIYQNFDRSITAVSYTHLRAHETGRNLVCRLLLEKKKNKKNIKEN